MPAAPKKSSPNGNISSGTKPPKNNIMTIIEQTLVAKNPKKKSEDGIVVTPDFIAVIDGSTSKTDYRHSLFRNNGREAMRLVSRYLRHAPKTITCHEFLRGVTAYIRKHYKKSMIPRLAEHPEERLTCSAIVYSRLQRQIWMIGDCQCLLDGQLLENPKPAEAIYDAKRAERAKQLLAEGKTVEELLTHDEARDYILPDIVASMQQQNITYAVIDGFPIPERRVPVITLDFQPHHLVFASDGYPFLRPTLEESERLLDEQRQRDPLNIDTFIASKAFMKGQDSFDDRTYIRFEV